ncbi:CopG family transcriptional regulator [Rhizobium calliandrae]|uniref:CopG family transcriptional regulator n=1 Tax=Rhizobium calliandrae TaxID=1312182 RepID=A0ABT7KJ34_9HYPH|nr:CopG family transcriptional regulator [Rhizobium calliandrae]MDL2408639.1 CopG family transcriptional regulator [Rhizobium calliandrae]
MTTRNQAAILEDAANRIGDISRADLQIILRRTALMLRNSASVTLDGDAEDAVASISDELGRTRNDMIRYIIQEWLEMNAYLPVRLLEEDGTV